MRSYLLHFSYKISPRKLQYRTFPSSYSIRLPSGSADTWFRSALKISPVVLLTVWKKRESMPSAGQPPPCMLIPMAPSFCFTANEGTAWVMECHWYGVSYGGNLRKGHVSRADVIINGWSLQRWCWGLVELGGVGLAIVGLTIKNIETLLPKHPLTFSSPWGDKGRGVEGE